MTCDTFWKIIDEVNSEVNHNDRASILNLTEKKLMQLTDNDIVEWHNIKGLYMDLAYRNILWAACAATHSHYTDDGFIDFRAWLISQGKNIYMKALNDPDSLSEIDLPKGTANFELYGYVACDAYAKKKAMECDGLTSGQINASSISELCQKYDVYDVADRHPLSKETVDAIMSKIELMPDIEPDWDASDLPEMFPRLHQKYNVEPKKMVSGQRMDVKEFKTRIQGLFPGADWDALRKWRFYAQELDRDGTCSATEFFGELYVEFALVKQYDGEEIARELFDAGQHFTFNPFEVRGAARLLKEGMAMEDVIQKAMDGFCDRTPQEYLQTEKYKLEPFKATSKKRHEPER